ncbi:MAG: hypothetical protein ABR501_02155 [Pyrinomonadaceae bacterium]
MRKLKPAASVGLLITGCCLLVAISANPTLAQNAAESRAASLRAQLASVQQQQEQLQTRLRQLDEDLKPENIEKNLAGVGSIRPEDLREQRRRQLEIERKGIQSQLDLLTTSRARLETGIAQAEADAYRQSAAPNTGGVPSRTTTTQTSTVDQGAANAPTIRRRTRRPKKKRKPRPVSQIKPLSADFADYTD